MKKLLIVLFLMTQALFSASFLMPDEAFKPSVTIKGDTVHVDIELGKQIYLYDEQLTYSMESKNYTMINEKRPKGHEHDGEMVHMPSFHSEFMIAKNSDSSAKEDVKFILNFQGCSEQGLCYEPMEKEYTLSIDNALLKNSSDVDVNSAPETGSTVEKIETPSPVVDDNVEKSETDSIADVIKDANIFVVLITFLGFGLLLSLTPCVFPMIPILSSVIVSQGENMTTKKAFFLSVVYVLAMAVAYTIAGVLAGLFGSNLQAAFQTPWVIFTFAGIFVALSLSMFDYYELQLPNSLQAKMSTAGQKQGGVMGVAIMGFLSALIVGPCVAAPLAGALIYIGQTGDAVLGGAALFAMSMGMGIPLIIVGTTAGKYMPRPGVWMDAIKSIFGVMMLFVAVWMLSRVIDGSITMFLFALLFMVPAVHMGAFESARSAKHRAMMANKKALGLIFFIIGSVLLLGSLSGAKNFLNPLEKFTAIPMVTGVTNTSSENKFQVIHSNAELDEIIAGAQGKTVMLDFYADWCTSCKEYEHNTFSDATVKAAMSDYILVQADVTKNSDQEKAMTKRFGLFGPPGIIFFKNGKEVQGKKIIGYKPPEEFLKLLQKI